MVDEGTPLGCPLIPDCLEARKNLFVRNAIATYYNSIILSSIVGVNVSPFGRFNRTPKPTND